MSCSLHKQSIQNEADCNIKAKGKTKKEKPPVSTWLVEPRRTRQKFLSWDFLPLGGIDLVHH